MVEEIAFMVTEGASKLAGVDEPASRTFFKVIDSGAAAGTFESSGLCGLSNPSRRDNTEFLDVRKTRNRLQQGIHSGWRQCTLTSVADDRVVSPAGYSYQNQQRKY